MKREHIATPEDESGRYKFPEGTDAALRERLVHDAALARSGWQLHSCDSPAPTDLRTIDVELVGGGRRSLKLRLRALDYVASDTTAADPPEERYPNVVARLADAIARAATTYTAGGDLVLAD